MGNVASGNGNRPRQKKKKAPAVAMWGWELKNGVMQPKALKQPVKPRPLFKRQASDNYNWWIGNPDPPRRTNSGRSLPRHGA